MLGSGIGELEWKSRLGRVLGYCCCWYHCCHPIVGRGVDVHCVDDFRDDYLGVGGGGRRVLRHL